MPRPARSHFNLILLGFACGSVGCAHPGPRLFPVAPVSQTELPDGAVERAYDLDGNGKSECRERLSSDGRVALLRFDLDQNGADELEVSYARPAVPSTASPAATPVESSAAASADRHLLIILDSVPYEIVRELWNAGRFRLFHPPVRVFSPFPVMTDLSLSEFFGVSPSPGAESEYFDGRRLLDGYESYAREANAANWLARTDYHLTMWLHAFAYLRPETWCDHELGRIQRIFGREKRNPFVGYVVGTSALGAHQGRDGHVAALTRLDRMCQRIVFDHRGRVRITLMSDHGHVAVPSKRIPLTEVLGRMGYRVTKRLSRMDDVVVPEFGVVSYAGVFTKQSQRVARDVANIEGVDFAAYLAEGDEVRIVGRRGEAAIGQWGSRFRYRALVGDPLGLAPIVRQLQKQDGADAEGFLEDRAWFEATAAHAYPDAPARLWRAFHGLMQHPPDVMISTLDGYHCGSKLMTKLVNISATHGNLGLVSSSGFVMTTEGTLPEPVRMADLRAKLIQLGVPLAGMGRQW